MLNQLVNMHLVLKEAANYYVHPFDRQYAISRLMPGEVSDRDSDEPRFTRYGLLHRAAEYFKQARSPRETGEALDDLEPRLAEFEFRCAGKDYEAAANVLLEISLDYLTRWSWTRHLIELCGRLLYKLNDRQLESRFLTVMGNAYLALGCAERARGYYENALRIAREIGDRPSESGNLTVLGLAKADLGQLEPAIKDHEEALEIAQRIGDRRGQAVALSNRGLAYADLGKYDMAIDSLRKALDIGREIGDRRGQGYALFDLARVAIALERFDDAIRLASEVVQIGEETHDLTIVSRGYSNIALARLSIGDLPGAREAAEAARRYDVPRNHHYVDILLGIIGAPPRGFDCVHRLVPAGDRIRRSDDRAMCGEL